MPEKRASQKAKSDNVFGQSRRQPKMFRAGLYTRVSTNDQQTLPMQMSALRDYVARFGCAFTSDRYSERKAAVGSTIVARRAGM
jgi:hypothetical protein